MHASPWQLLRMQHSARLRRRKKERGQKHLPHHATWRRSMRKREGGKRKKKNRSPQRCIFTRIPRTWREAGFFFSLFFSLHLGEDLLFSSLPYFHVLILFCLFLKKKKKITTTTTTDAFFLTAHLEAQGTRVTRQTGNQAHSQTQRQRRTHTRTGSANLEHFELLAKGGKKINRIRFFFFFGTRYRFHFSFCSCLEKVIRKLSPCDSLFVFLQVFFFLFSDLFGLF